MQAHKTPSVCCKWRCTGFSQALKREICHASYCSYSDLLFWYSDIYTVFPVTRCPSSLLNLIINRCPNCFTNVAKNLEHFGTDKVFLRAFVRFLIGKGLFHLFLCNRTKLYLEFSQLNLKYVCSCWFFAVQDSTEMFVQPLDFLPLRRSLVTICILDHSIEPKRQK